jgi:valyl-tRNA synthetase
MEPKLEGTRWEKGFEEPIRKKWKQQKAYGFDPKERKPVFSIDTPPPYVNAPIHMGHATTYTIMDMIARYKRMAGFNVLFPLGLDRNGIPIEVTVEKKYNISVNSTDREKFIQLCEKMLEESSLESLDTFYKLGHSYNSWERGESLGDIYYTDSDEYRLLTQSTFIDMVHKGLVYKAKRVSNYCPVCGTTIADADIVYRDIETSFNYVRFAIKETGEKITIGTTRPELLNTCEMVLYNPADERYKYLEGKHAVIPLYDKVVPIKAHPYAKMDSGTGLVMMCSYGDYTDIRFFREMKLKETIAIEADGRMNKQAGFLEGLRVKDGRSKILDMLKEKDLLEKQENIMHRTPVCERTRNPIEFIAMPAYYLKQVAFKKDMRKVADQMRFFAPPSKQILLDWIDTVSMDWPISRKRYYATEVPLWHCKCGEIIVPPKGKYYRPWKEKCPVKKCPKCGSSEFTPELSVFDTWFDSSVSPLKILRYGKDKFFDKAYPCSLRPQGKEIVRTWLYYTLLRCYHITKKPAFENAWIHFHVLDEKGTKMSKSLGNVIDPQAIIEKYGAEPFRAWCALEGNITVGDIRCSFERIDGASKFLTKLWNIARFISVFDFGGSEAAEPTQVDLWILSETAKLVEATRKDYDDFDFHSAVTRIKNFIWENFASHYLEMVKERAYNQDRKFSIEEQAAAVQTLNQVLDTLITLLSPVTPFLCQKIYGDLRQGDINALEFPKPSKKLLEIQMPFKTEELLELNGMVWKAKKDKGLSLKEPVEKLTVPESFRPIEKELVSMHGVRKLEYGKDVKIQIK